MPTRKLDPTLRARIRRVKCLLLDVDGVLTDGKLYVGSDGSEAKTFDIRDGSGVKLAQMAGLTVGWITGRASAATARRAKDLAVDWLIQGSNDKARGVREVQRKAGVTSDQVCFVGDDLLDIPALKIVGLPVAVADAAAEARALARYVTRANGGNGAVREVVELIVKTQGLWEKALEAYWQHSSSPRQ